MTDGTRGLSDCGAGMSEHSPSCPAKRFSKPTLGRAFRFSFRSKPAVPGSRSLLPALAPRYGKRGPCVAVPGFVD